MPRAGMAVTVLLFVLAGTSLRAQPAGSEGAYDLAISTLLCDCGCHPQSVKECACGRAAEMRTEIAALIRSGGEGGSPMTGEAVIARYVAQHGEQIRIAPTARGFNLVAWLGPLVGLVGATLAVAVVLRHWNRRRVAVDATPELVPHVAADDPYRDRLRRELERLQ